MVKFNKLLQSFITLTLIAICEEYHQVQILIEVAKFLTITDGVKFKLKAKQIFYAYLQTLQDNLDTSHVQRRESCPL